jgi:hypothetical protein
VVVVVLLLRLSMSLPELEWLLLLPLSNPRAQQHICCILQGIKHKTPGARQVKHSTLQMICRREIYYDKIATEPLYMITACGRRLLNIAFRSHYGALDTDTPEACC